MISRLIPGPNNELVYEEPRDITIRFPIHATTADTASYVITSSLTVITSASSSFAETSSLSYQSISASFAEVSSQSYMSVSASLSLTSSLDKATLPLTVEDRTVRIINSIDDTITKIDAGPITQSNIYIPTSKAVWDAAIVSTGNGVIEGMQLIKGALTGSFNINSGSYYSINSGVISYDGTS